MSDHKVDRAEGAWRELLDYVRPFRFSLIVGGLLSLATAATGLALPLAVRELVTGLDSDRSITGLLVLMAVLVLANATIGALGSYLLDRTAESVVLRARHRLLSHLLFLRIPAVDRSEPGDLMSRVTSDTTLLREVATSSLVSAVTGILTLAATVIMMALLDPLLLGVTFAVLALAQVVVRVVVPRIAQASRHAQDSIGAMGAALERALGALRTVKASGAEDREQQRLYAAATEAWKGGVRAAKWQAVAGNIGGLAVQVSFIVVLGLGGARVVSGAIDVGTLVAFLLYLYYLMPPMRDIIDAVAQYQVGAAAIARIRAVEVLPVEPIHEFGMSTGTAVGRMPRGVISTGTSVKAFTMTSAGTAGHHTDPAGVAFEHVRFRYRPELPEVHRGVTFDVPPGGMTAFVGPSGAGKTTVFSLIERFYEASSGRVLVNGSDVLDWPLALLRAAIGYVEQDAPVVSGTLRENLIFGAPHATDVQLQEALTVTRLDSMVNALPDGVDTRVGHRGITLSGGERQRVAIARALLRRPRLLLLDEVTSQLDAVNEAALRDTISSAARTTTVLVVAHRLSTVAAADRIVVMDHGQVRALGTHADLLTADPLYRELATTQLIATDGSLDQVTVVSDDG
jgi:ATP-binding cassette subfamily C protein